MQIFSARKQKINDPARNKKTLVMGSHGTVNSFIFIGGYSCYCGNMYCKQNNIDVQWLQICNIFLKPYKSYVVMPKGHSYPLGLIFAYPP